jgi:hypothetical protein
MICIKLGYETLGAAALLALTTGAAVTGTAGEGEAEVPLEEAEAEEALSVSGAVSSPMCLSRRVSLRSSSSVRGSRAAQSGEGSPAVVAVVLRVRGQVFDEQRHHAQQTHEASLQTVGAVRLHLPLLRNAKVALH